MSTVWDKQFCGTFFLPAVWGSLSPFPWGFFGIPRRSVPGCLVGCLLRLALLLALVSAVVVGWVIFWPKLSGSAPLLTFQDQADGISAMSWSPDSTRIASSGSGINGGPSNVQILDVRVGRTVLTYRG